MLYQMGEAGVTPSVDTFNTLMDACLMRSDPQAVVRLFQQMQQSGQFPGSTFQRSWVLSLVRC